ncbi:hypothetical protein CEXT_69061 [Caerostris extrusa]|uniref:Uncharacterized protein n=1 Tax=Caerostris extrusa TaxID=172846 RepID=A0AAV4TAK3_CAEEX|nr:hypothetical protein CEXT_69061 [Caerostris extrusa]
MYNETDTESKGKFYHFKPFTTNILQTFIKKKIHFFIQHELRHKNKKPCSSMMISKPPPSHRIIKTSPFREIFLLWKTAFHLLLATPLLQFLDMEFSSSKKEEPLLDCVT